jgi:predicted permease
VETAGYANAAPLVERSGFGSPRIQGTPLPIQGQPEFRQVSQEYFSTMGIRLIAGRGFSVNDGPGDPRVVVVNRAMLSYFGGGSAIGKTLTLAGNPAEIVGIVDDTHEKALNLEPRPEVYLNSRQSVASYKHAEALQWAYFVVRTGGDPAALIPSVQTIVRETIPGATLKLNTSTLEEIVYRSIGLPRFYTVLLSLFGALAVFLAMIGVYGITTYAVAHRTREIGIRIALGAGRLAVLGLEIRRTAVLSMAGIAVGLTGAAMLTRYLEGMLFGLTPMDPMTFAAIPAAFAVTALLAAYVPARRAMKVDPVVALRQE